MVPPNMDRLARAKTVGDLPVPLHPWSVLGEITPERGRREAVLVSTPDPARDGRVRGGRRKPRSPRLYVG